jgi:hypothetical protein
MDRSTDNPQPADPEIEAQLLALPLARPSQMLDARVRQSIGRLARRIRQRWLAAGLAAVLVLAAVLFSTEKKKTPAVQIATNTPALPGVALNPAQAQHPPASPGPVRIIRTLSALCDDGVVATIGGRPVECLRQVEVDQVVGFDPARGCTVVYRRPREHLLLMNSRTY